MNRPEQTLVGIMFDSIIQTAPIDYIVANSSNWVYEGTGLRDGDALPGILGTVLDGYMPGYAHANAVSQTLLSNSPYTDFQGVAKVANSSIYQAPSGAWVFAAGTIEWPWGLAGGPGTPSVADATVQRMTANLFERAGLPASSPGATFGAKPLP